MRLPLPLPGPGDLLRLTERGYEAVETAIGLVPRLVTLVGQVEEIVVRAQKVVGEVDVVQKRASAVVASTEKVVARADALVTRTGSVVDTAEQLTGQLTPLLDRFKPSLDSLEPVLARLAETTSPEEVDALVKLIDNLPELTDRLDRDIFPVLDTLGTVAPDLRDLLDISRELNEMLGALPGLGRVKRRIEAQQAEEDARESRTADEDPPSAPDRH